jgi:hypothetical protein
MHNAPLYGEKNMAPEGTVPDVPDVEVPSV